MNKGKKQHYVPQCYLKNFQIPGADEKINVFDKRKAEIRLNQPILDNACERYFYDINIDKLLSETSEDNRSKILKHLGKKYEVYKDDQEQYVEKFFSNSIEGEYSTALKSIIKKAENANSWCIKECYCMSVSEKTIMAFCIAMQYLRTKKQRVMLKEGTTKLYKEIMAKINYFENKNQKDPNQKDNLYTGDIEFKIGKESMKLQHERFMFDFDIIVELTQVFHSHIWVIYINKTEVPFWTSDAPIALNPISYGNECDIRKGIASKGMEIIFPLSPIVALGMYDREEYGNVWCGITKKDDRIYIELNNPNTVKMFNKLQITESYRCVYSCNSDFGLAERICRENPELKEEQEYFIVG